MDPHEVFIGQAITDDQIQAYSNAVRQPKQTSEKKLSGWKEMGSDLCPETKNKNVATILSFEF